MSKKSKTKKKNKNKTSVTKKPFNKFKIAIPVAVILIIIGIIVSVVFINSNSDAAKIKSALCSTKWVPLSATDASGDEVDMAQIYNTNYTSYKGTLEYFDDNTFSFWLTPGAADDGTHSGEYEIEDESTVNMYFDDGTDTRFTIKYDNNQVISVEVNYDDYEIIFSADE